MTEESPGCLMDTLRTDRASRRTCILCAAKDAALMNDIELPLFQAFRQARFVMC